MRFLINYFEDCLTCLCLPSRPSTLNRTDIRRCKHECFPLLLLLKLTHSILTKSIAKNYVDNDRMSQHLITYSTVPVAL